MSMARISHLRICLIYCPVTHVCHTGHSVVLCEAARGSFIHKSRHHALYIAMLPINDKYKSYVLCVTHDHRS